MNEQPKNGIDNGKDVNPDCKIVKIASKYKKGDKIPITLTEEGSTEFFNIELDGVKIAWVDLKDNDNSGIRRIGNIVLNPSLKEKGIGKQMYIMLNDYVKSLDGSVLGSSDTKITLDAIHIWNSLYNDGLVEKETISEKPRFRFKK